jgi:hypothetical protein
MHYVFHDRVKILRDEPPFVTALHTTRALFALHCKKNCALPILQCTKASATAMILRDLKI